MLFRINCWRFLGTTPNKTHRPQIGPPLLRDTKRKPKITFSRLSREICTFEKNLRSPKIFCMKFSTKMVPMKIFVAIISTKLQRSESRGPEISSSKQTPQARVRSKLRSCSKSALTFTLEPCKVFPSPRTLSLTFSQSGPGAA